MERYLQIGKVNLKYNIKYQFIVIILLFIACPYIMGYKNLDSTETARVLEFYVSFIGIIILAPLFKLDDDKSIRELIQSKKQPVHTIHIVCIAEALIFALIVLFCFMMFLKYNNCSFPFCEYFYGEISTCIFLGGLGVLFYGIFYNIVIAYMIPLLYYIICFSGARDILGNFHLFLMTSGETYKKIYLLISGIIMIACGIIFRNIKSRLV